MKKLILTSAAAFVAICAQAQTLNVNCGNVTYNFASEEVGVMNFGANDNGRTLTVQGKEFAHSEISGMKVNDNIVTPSLVTIDFNGAQAYVNVAGNVAQYVTVAIDGANVSIEQSELVDETTCGEITYRLAGTSAQGSVLLTGTFKTSVELNGLTLTSATGAAITIQNGKRIAMRVAEGTVNTLVDAAGGTQKGCIDCKGHLEFKQKGVLNVTSKTGHGIFSKEYIQLKNSQINVLGSVKDGLNCNQYFQMDSGSLTITGAGDDAIQVSYKDEIDREAEDTGSITINGGTINVTATAAAAKGIKADGNITINGGDITVKANGGAIWDTTKSKTKAAACIGADGDVTIADGTFNLSASGGGGKGISCDGNLTVDGGTFTIATTGGMAAYTGGTINQNYTGNSDSLNSDYKSSAKAIKVDSDIVINGGNFNISTAGNGAEGIESKKTLTIAGGTLKIRAYDDGTNSSSHTYIKGGDLEVISQKGDAVDSNGAIYVSGGVMRIFGAASPEQGWDAGDGYTIYFTGGTMLAAGGGNSAPTNSQQSTQAYVIPSGLTLTAGSTVTISNGSTTLASFQIPSDYNASQQPGIPPFGAPGGNQGGGNRPGQGGAGALLISCPQLVSGTSYTISNGSASVTATAQLTGGSSGPGGMGF